MSIYREPTKIEDDEFDDLDDVYANEATGTRRAMLATVRRLCERAAELDPDASASFVGTACKLFDCATGMPEE